MNLARLIEEHVESYGDYESTFFEGRWYSTGEGVERVRAVGAGLQELGVEPGDRIAVMLPNCPEVGITYWASWRIGAAVTPIVFLLPPPEIRRILEHSGARVLVTSPDFLLTIATAAEGVDTLEHIVSVGGGEGVLDFSELETSGVSELVERDADDPAALLYTGGTTGASKGVVLSHRNLEWTARAAADASELAEDEVGLLALPLSHSFGLHVSIVGGLRRSTGVLMRWFDPAEMVEIVPKHSVRRMALVPSMLQMLLATPLEDHDLSSLTFITSGAAGLPPEVLAEWEKRVPGSAILQGYGLTETSPTVAVQPPSSVADGTRKIGSVGPPIDGVEVRIAGDEGQSPGPGEVGEITVKGPNVMLGYHNDPEATKDAIRDGYFHTGDMGKLDEDGHLWIVDRKKDLIIRGGFNVYPTDVESALLEHPSISEAGVIGRPSEKFGEEPVAFVVASGELDENDVVAFSQERLAKYKRPVEVRIVPQLPKTPVGKTDKKALRAEL
jgi:long-chain acyl-CoA synthetase